MSIRNTYPTIRPSLSLNFARSRTLDPRITFSRTTTGTYMDADGLIKVASADEARFDHSYDPVSGTVRSLGLLVEEQSTNSLLYSNDFSQNSWIKQNSHPVPTQDVIGPDGVSGSGWRFYRTSTNQYIYQSIIGAGTHTLSAWVRSEEATGDFRMSGYNATNGTMQTSFTATNEWRRFNITISPTVNTNYYPCIPTNTNKTFYVYGAQVELNKSFPTSYIPTEGSTKTRTHDRAYYENVDQTNWFNKTEGTVVFEHTDVPYNAATPAGYPAIGFGRTSDGGSQPSIQYYIGKNDTGAQYLVRTQSAGDSANINTTPYSTGNTGGKVGFVYKENDYVLSKDGEIEGIDSLGAVPDAYMLIFGMNVITNPTNNMNAHIKNLQYYPTRLTNSQLVSLTR